ncbi:MAG: hypothetical protein AAGD23_07530, partial [Pseudomonadota bacterium]
VERTDILSKADSAKLEALRKKRAEAPTKTTITAEAKPRPENATEPTARAAKQDQAPPAKTATTPTAPKQPPVKGTLGDALRKRQAAPPSENKTEKAKRTAPAPRATEPARPPEPWHLRLKTWAHAHLIDHYKAPRERVATGAPFLRQPQKPIAKEALATPRQIIRTALDMLPEPPQGFTFVDLGCGAGRVIYEAALRPFDRIVGFERDEDRYDSAMANLRLWPRSTMVCRDIDIYHEDLLNAELPDSDMVAYMYGLDDGRLMSFLVSKLTRHARQGRRLYLILVNPKHLGFLEKSPSFTLQPIQPKTRLLLRLISPFPVNVYQIKPTSIAEAAASRRLSG